MQGTRKHSPAAILVILFALLALLLPAPRACSQDATTLTATPAEAVTALAARASGPLPAGTRLLSLRVTDGLAVADFSRELKANFAGGDSQEVAAVNSILRVLGRYHEISRAQITMAGKPLDSLGGLLVLSGPLPVLRPDQDNAGQPRRRFFHRQAAPEKAKTAPRAHHAFS